MILMDDFNQEYDYGSVLHYGPTAFSINGERTIIPIYDDDAAGNMGQRRGMSKKDINKLNLMYHCPREIPFPHITYIEDEVFYGPSILDSISCFVLKSCAEERHEIIVKEMPFVCASTHFVAEFEYTLLHKSGKANSKTKTLSEKLYPLKTDVNDDTDDNHVKLPC
uniref:Metalloendopeptidase n=1 Tax=Glossina brevipalpis TaxID=37001 RepID=A0A1A9WUH2_9MUSC